jgi:uncharacterized protein
MRTYERTVPAPADLGYPGVVAVEQDSDVELALRVESVVEGVLVSGDAAATISGECSRCLDEFDEEITASYTELFAYPDSATDITTEVDEVSRVDGYLIDIEAIVHDAILLALPQAPLCTPDCQGLCPGCGRRRADLGPDHKHETIDPRWAGLAGRLSSDTSHEPEEN